MHKKGASIVSQTEKKRLKYCVKRNTNKLSGKIGVTHLTCPTRSGKQYKMTLLLVMLQKNQYTKNIQLGAVALSMS